jgi:hypothetical protein
MAKTLDQVVSRWTSSTAGGQQAFVDGIQGTTVDPTQLAIANQAGYLSGVQQSVGLWAANLAKAGKAKWQANSVAKAGNWTTGVNQGATAYQSSMSTWYPILQQTGATARAMPGQTIDQRIARSAYVARTLYNRKRGL